MSTVNPFDVASLEDLHRLCSEADEVTRVKITKSGVRSSPSSWGFSIAYLNAIYSAVGDFDLVVEWLDLENENEVRYLLENPVSYLSVLYAREIFSGREGVPSKQSLTRAISERAERRHGLVSKRSAQFITVDYSLERYKYPPSLYENLHGNYRVKGVEAFSMLVRAFFSELVRDVSPRESWIHDVSYMFYECFFNTHEHALPRKGLGLKNKSVRGLLLRHHLISDHKDIGKHHDESSVQYRYLDSLRSEPVGGPVHYLEVCIFDRGMGMAESLRRSDPRYEEWSSKDLFLECFKKGVTSKPYSEGYGEGLHIAAEALRKKHALLAIVSGRDAAFLNFSSGWKGGGENIKEKIEGYVTLGAHCGTIWSILVPVRGV